MPAAVTLICRLLSAIDILCITPTMIANVPQSHSFANTLRGPLVYGIARFIPYTIAVYASRRSALAVSVWLNLNSTHKPTSDEFSVIEWF